MSGFGGKAAALGLLSETGAVSLLLGEKGKLLQLV